MGKWGLGGLIVAALLTAGSSAEAAILYQASLTSGDIVGSFSFERPSLASAPFSVPAGSLSSCSLSYFGETATCLGVTFTAPNQPFPQGVGLSPSVRVNATTTAAVSTIVEGGLSLGAHDLLGFDGSVRGSLTITDLDAVPEPASWALMIGGLGAVGAAARRRTGRPATA